jgi:hypothetical protein
MHYSKDANWGLLAGKLQKLRFKFRFRHDAACWQRD